MMTPASTFPVSDDRIEARQQRITEAIVRRIRAEMGTMTQAALADQIGKSGSTVSNHLNGRTNLTLKTVVQYAVALDADIVSVLDVKRPTKRRRRGGRVVSEERKSLADIDPVKRKLHDLLSDLTARIGQIIQADDSLSQRELARRMDRDETYVSRALAGGINLTLKTVAAFEEALGTPLLHVEGTSRNAMVSAAHRSRSPAQFIRRSPDGGSYVNHGGVCATMDAYVHRTTKGDAASPSTLESSPCPAYG